MTDVAPLILTLRLDEAHQTLFDRLRSDHFPPERNFLDAHVTLFHALPGEAEAEIASALATLAAETPAPRVTVEPPFSLGRGVAFRLRSPEADALREKLAARWADRLTSQDRAKARLHVTVQNKVGPADARALLAELSADFRTSGFASPGLDLWRYLGGPWSHVAGPDFRG